MDVRKSNRQSVIIASLTKQRFSIFQLWPPAPTLAADARDRLDRFRFLGSGPKEPMSCRTQGGISRRPSIRPSFRPFPPGHQSLNSAVSGLILAL